MFYWAVTWGNVPSCMYVFLRWRSYSMIVYEPAQTKPTKWHVRPAKTQISLGIRPVWSESSVRMKKAWNLSYPLNLQSAWRKLGTLATHWRLGSACASAQAGRMHRLIRVFTGRTFCWFTHALAHFVVQIGIYPDLEFLFGQARFQIWLNFYLDYILPEMCTWLSVTDIGIFKYRKSQFMYSGYELTTPLSVPVHCSLS